MNGFGVAPEFANAASHGPMSLPATCAWVPSAHCSRKGTILRRSITSSPRRSRRTISFPASPRSCRNVGAIDISAACAGFAYALDLADALIATGRARNVLVVAGETLTKITDYTDRAMCILFGDGAGAALVTPDDGSGSRILARRLNSDGAAGKHLFLTALKKEIAGIVEPQHLMRQNGRAVYEWVVTHVSTGISELLASADVRPSDVDWFIPHSANMRMIESVCERSGMPPERTLTSMQWFGNTSSASIPLALAPAIADGRVKRGDKVLLYGFGGGLVEAGLLLRW